MKRFTPIIIIFLIAAFFFYLLAEKVLMGKIKDDIESSLGNDYAIIALHVAGENSHRPALWRMLKKALIYELNINDEYSPMGSGRYTGKKHHLAILISNNEQIIFAEWSFRSFGLVFQASEYIPYDVIKNLPESDQKIHSFVVEDIKNREGLNYKDEVLNDEQISFYYRAMKPGISDFNP